MAKLLLLKPPGEDKPRRYIIWTGGDELCDFIPLEWRISRACPKLLKGRGCIARNLAIAYGYPNQLPLSIQCWFGTRRTSITWLYWFRYLISQDSILSPITGGNLSGSNPAGKFRSLSCHSVLTMVASQPCFTSTDTFPAIHP